MKCKYCQAELESNSSVCPACHKDNLKDELKGLKIAALVLVCVVMLVLLAGLVCYGATGSFVPDWFGGNADGTNPTEPVDNSHKVVTSAGVITVEDEELEEAMQEVVATMGAYKLTNQQLQFYYWSCAYNDTGKADLSKDLTQQVYDKETGETYHQHFLEMAIDSWQEIMLMYGQAEKAGYVLPQSYKDELASLEEDLEDYVAYYNYYGYKLSGVDDLIAMQFGAGCDFDAYYDYTHDYYYGALYWADEVDNFEVTEDEINDYFTENEESLSKDYDISVTKDFGNLVDIRNILINVVMKEVEGEDGKKTKVEDWEATQAKIQQIYDEYMAGEQTAERFIELVTKYSEDEGSKTAGGLYTDLYRNSMAEVDVRHILFFPEGATSENVTSKEWPEEAWEAARAKAQQVLDEYLAGEQTAEAFGALANEHSADNNGKVTNGGLYEDVYVGQMVKAFEQWCFDASRQPGDTGIVKTEYGYHVMYFVRADRAAEDWCFEEGRAAGDVGIAKTDKGYMMLYFVDSEAAWHRYSRYGVQAEKAKAALEALVEANPVTLSEDAIMIAMISG